MSASKCVQVCARAQVDRAGRRLRRRCAASCAHNLCAGLPACQPHAGPQTSSWPPGNASVHIGMPGSAALPTRWLPGACRASIGRAGGTAGLSTLPARRRSLPTWASPPSGCRPSQVGRCTARPAAQGSPHGSTGAQRPWPRGCGGCRVRKRYRVLPPCCCRAPKGTLSNALVVH